MESFLRYWLTWPVVENFLRSNSWGWSLNECLHYVGLCLLIGAVGMFDLRLLGIARRLPVKPLRQLLPWGAFGFVLCVVSGLTFVTGLRANVPVEAYDALMTDRYLQWKLLFILFAGMNLLAFYLTGMSRAVDRLGPGDDAPPMAKAIAGTSLFLWVGVVYWGRLIPWGLPL